MILNTKNGFFRDITIPSAFASVVDNLLTEVTKSANDLSVIRPAADILESPETYALHIMLPGISKEDIKIELKGKNLTISAERKDSLPEGAKSISTEIYHGKFQRTFTLPANATDKISAAFNNGILEIGIAKADPADGITNIEIK